MNIFLSCIVVWLLAVAMATILPGQRRVVVDSANGPGTDYVDLDPAVAASQPGDIIIIRPGNGSYYTLNRDIRHGLRLVAPGPVSPTVAADRSVQIPAGQLFVIDNIRLGGPRPPYGLIAQGCRGTVIVSRTSGPMTQAQGCDRIVYTDCHNAVQFEPALVIETGSTAYVLDSVMTARYSYETGFFRAGVYVRGNSRIRLVNATVQGGTPGLQSGISYSNPGMVVLPDSRASVFGRSTFTGGRAFLSFPQAPGIQAGGPPQPGFPPPMLILDPDTQCHAPRVTDGYELLHESPVVSPSDAVQGQMQALDVIGPRNSIVAVFAGLLTARPPIVTSMGDIWLDGPVVTIGAGPVDANRDLRLSLTIPSWLPQGEVLVYQAMSLSPQQLFEIGPPGFAVVQ